MDISIEFLRNCSFFSSLKEKELYSVFEKLQKIELKEGEYLFREGESDDALYILASGKLEAITTHKQEDLQIGFIRPGELIGELAFFSNQPRSASIKAVHTSVILRFDKKDFQELCNRNSSLLWEVTAFIANRAQLNVRSFHRKIKNQIIALVCVKGQINPRQIISDLRKQNLEKYKIDFVEVEELKKSGNLVDWFQKTQKNQSTVILAFDTDDLISHPKWLSFIDKIVVALKDSSTDLNFLSNLLHENLEKKGAALEKQLLLLHDEPQVSYPNTQRYLDMASFSRCYHVCIKAPVSCRRFLRFLSGHAIGLVLSGGGIKGWAMAGAMEALIEQDFEIDYLGGSSVGGALAAYYALCKGREDFFDRLNKIGKSLGENLMSMKSMTLPLISIFNGKKETETYQKFFGQTMIQDLALPFFCISTNLSLQREHIWERGYLWQAVRATTALPPLVPPLVSNGQIHVDGMFVDNFPVRIMSSRLDNRGFIIGIEIVKELQDPVVYNFPPAIGIFEALKIKFNLIKPKINYIGILEIMERAIAAEGRHKSEMNSKIVDLSIKLNLRNFRSTDFSRRNEMRDFGYQETKKKLENANFG